MARIERNATGLPAADERRGNSSNSRTAQQQQNIPASAIAVALPHYPSTWAILVLLLGIGIVFYPRWNSESSSLKPVGTLHSRSYFYVGQSYIERNGTKEPSGMMYVEHLAPPKTKQPYPLLFLAGNGRTWRIYSPVLELNRLLLQE